MGTITGPGGVIPNAKTPNQGWANHQKKAAKSMIQVKSMQVLKRAFKFVAKCAAITKVIRGAYLFRVTLEDSEGCAWFSLL